MASRNLQISFGPVVCLAKIESATVSTPSMSNMCVGQPGHEAHEPKPVKAPKTCDTCGTISDYTLLKKGMKSGKTYIVVDQAQVAEAKEEYAQPYKHKIALVPHPSADFLPATAQGDTIHYVVPADEANAENYQLLLRLVKDHPELSFAGLHTPVSATALYMLAARGNVLVLEKRERSQALKPAPSVGGTLNELNYEMMSSFLERFITPYDADAYEDKYGAALEQMLAEGETVSIDTGTATTVAAPATGASLLEQLRALKEAAA